ncbi:MAG: tetratricopeptide repeat protein [Candidatus Zixiibacteriota bacterium]
MRAPGIAGGSFNKAKEQAAAISKIDSARGHLAFAYIYEREKDYPAAEQELKKAIEFAPERTEPYFRLGSFYWDQKDFEKAEAAYVKAVENDPDEPRAYYQLGWFYQIRNEHERAIEAFQKILEMNPDEANALFFLASSYLDLKEFEMADEVLAKILKINPDYTGVNFLRGKQALLSGKNLEQGIGYLEKYLQIDPQEMYHPSWSYTHLMAGIESYGPSWAAAHFIMGLIYEDLGNRKKAEKEYKKALKLDPKLVRAKEALERLK